MVGHLRDLKRFLNIFYDEARQDRAFIPHVNIEFGEVKIYSPAVKFLTSLIAISIMRLPLDILIWIFIFYIGYILGS
jgi:hypothetical protein